MPDRTGGRTGDNEAHEHVELDGRVLRLDARARPPRLSRRSRPGSRSTTATRSGKPRCTSGSCSEPIPATIGPGKRFKRRLKKIYLRLPMRPLVRFVYAYVLRLGFLDGKPGLVFCTLLAFYDFLAWANVYERRVAGDGPRMGPERNEPQMNTDNTDKSPLTGSIAASGSPPGRDRQIDRCLICVHRVHRWL